MPKKSGFVYLVECAGQYKIGKAKDMVSRLADFSVFPFAVNLVHKIVTNNPLKLEGFLHGLFRGKRMRGEWFDLGVEDISYIKSCTRAVYPNESTGQSGYIARDSYNHDYTKVPKYIMDTRPEGDGWRLEFFARGTLFGWRRGKGPNRKFVMGGKVANHAA